MQKTALLDVGPTKIVTFPHFKVPHGCSTRVGGVSQKPWDSLNAGFTVGDPPESVWENRDRFSACLGVSELTWLLSMDHGHQVAEVLTRPKGPFDRTQKPKTHYSADACITNRAGVPLSLTVADCVPVLFHDPVTRAIGLAHAGWRGTVAGIVKETVEAMAASYGCRPEDILVGIGPSIGPLKFEVGSEVAEEFSKEFGDQSPVVRPHPDPDLASQGKFFVDLWEANTLMALRAGVLRDNVVVSGWCTVSHPELFFSHRRDQGKTGRLLAGLILPLEHDAP